MKKVYVITELLKEKKELPRCPYCDLILAFEERDYDDDTKRKIETQNKCEHEWEGNVITEELYTLSRICSKCGYQIFTMFYQSARKMRCVKCGRLYHVEEAKS